MDFHKILSPFSQLIHHLHSCFMLIEHPYSSFLYVTSTSHTKYLIYRKERKYVSLALIRLFKIIHKFSIELKSGLCAGHSRHCKSFLSFQTLTTCARCIGVLSSCKIVAKRRLRRLRNCAKKCFFKMSLYFFPVAFPSVSMSGPTPSIDMHTLTIMDGSPVLIVPSVKVGIHSSVDFRHANTLPSQPLIFIFDSSEKNYLFPERYCFFNHLFSPLYSLFLIFRAYKRLFTSLSSIVP